jgi:hypothetical protein
MVLFFYWFKTKICQKSFHINNYEPDAFEGPPGHGWNELVGEPNQRIAGTYIMDKVVNS